MRYCRKCVLPDTKPYLSFNDEGICSACQASGKKRDAQGGIDWAEREAQFGELVGQIKKRNAKLYDVLVPVSGGKDSISQVARLLKFDLRILAVNVDYGIKTEIGHQNLALIPDMGANLIIYRPEQKIHRRLIRIGFEDFGDPDLLSHTMLHGYPLRVALHFGVPLVWLGENSAFEYGGDPNVASKNHITREWFTNYAANKGHDAGFVSRTYDIPMANLLPYDFPDELETSETKAVFMSHFFYWDSEIHLEIAKEYGFQTLDGAREGTYRNYVGVDEKINRIHQYMKVLKFGYGRASDHACEDIRNGRLTRDEAVKLVKEFDLQPLSDDYIDDFAAYLDYTREQVIEILERSRNRDIWKKDTSGRWYIPQHLGL